MKFSAALPGAHGLGSGLDAAQGRAVAEAISRRGHRVAQTQCVWMLPSGDSLGCDSPLT